MKRQYDFVFLTNTPSFYKLNLCNEIAKTHSILLVLYGYGSEAVNKVLSEDNEYLFDYNFIHKGDANARNKFFTFKNLIHLMYSVRCEKTLFAGWLAPEYILYAFLSCKKKNVVISESSVWDVSFKGIKGGIKSIFINRMSTALPSGTPHEELFKKIKFKGDIYQTGGVGIFHKKSHREINTKKNDTYRYLYVGRLTHVKNLKYLIQVFNQNGKSLTIVGMGELETKLRSIAKSNICFKGFVDNELLGDIYSTHDVFILPSISEPWGLVVDEALYWGLPVIVSSRVGAGMDLVSARNTGVVFDIADKDGLCKAIAEIEEKYDYYRFNVEQIDFDERDRMQVAAYTNLIKK